MEPTTDTSTDRVLVVLLHLILIQIEKKQASHLDQKLDGNSFDEKSDSVSSIENPTTKKRILFSQEFLLLAKKYIGKTESTIIKS